VSYSKRLWNGSEQPASGRGLLVDEPGEGPFDPLERARAEWGHACNSSAERRPLSRYARRKMRGPGCPGPPHRAIDAFD